MSRNSIARPVPQLAETFSEGTVIEDPTIRQPNITDTHTNQLTSQSNIQLTDFDDFARRFDHAALEFNSATWTNLPETIDLSTLQVERIPEELFAPETMRQPQYVEEEVDASPKDCEIVLAVFRCGNYAFFTAQCFDHFVTTRESNRKPVGICNPKVLPERHLVPYFCGQDNCPVCDDLEKSVSALAVHQRNWLPN